MLEIARERVEVIRARVKWWRADRIKKFRPLESEAMGRTPVLVKATGLAGIGMAQALGGYGTHVLNQFGHRPIDLAWGSMLALAAVFVWWAWFQRKRDLRDAINLELIGMGLMDFGLAWAAFALISMNGFNGTSLWLWLAVDPILNTVGRGFHLLDQKKVLPRTVA